MRHRLSKLRARANRAGRILPSGEKLVADPGPWATAGGQGKARSALDHQGDAGRGPL